MLCCCRAGCGIHGHFRFSGFQIVMQVPLVDGGQLGEIHEVKLSEYDVCLFFNKSLLMLLY